MSGTHRTARNLAIVSSAMLVQQIVQLLIQRSLAELFGAQQETDAYTTALALPTLFSAFISGSLGYVLVPELVAQFEKNEANQSSTDGQRFSAGGYSAWQLASFTGLLITLISVGCSGLLWWWSRSICGNLYSLTPTQLDLTAEMLRILSVQVVLNGWISWAQAVHHSRHHFLAPALGGALGTALTLGMLATANDPQITLVGWAINAGSLVSVVIHVVPLLPCLAVPRADSSNLWRLLAMYWPLLIGTAYLRIEPLVDRVLATDLGEKAPSQVHFSQRFIAALLALGTSGLAVIAFPQLAEKHATGGRETLGEHFAIAFRRMLLIALPVLIGVSAFAPLIIRDLLELGRFTSDDSIIVGWLVIASMGMFLGGSGGELLSRCFYVLGDTKTPTLIGVCSLTFGLIAKYFLVLRFGIWGIALGVSIYYVLSASSMLLLLIRRLGLSSVQNSLSYAVQACLSSAAACGVCYLVYRLPAGNTWLAAPCGVLCYAVGLLLLKNSDAIHTIRMTLQRFSDLK